MLSADIRSTFLSYFESHGHAVVPSASLVPSSYDPSVLLTTAGMQPFKPYFRGEQQPPGTRLTSCQKCFRTPDIDEVGNTARHLTFFEMLGNFSFGDYFKAGAIEMAWDIVTGKLGIDPSLLWATVHEGDASMGLGIDQEAVDLWLQAGIDRDRIVALGDDNFWKAGPTGPCGPCSEIYYDRGEAYGCGSSDCKPGCDCDRYLEFYNLVFMQYDRDEHGTLNDLPKQNIDTGMGLERISSLLQGNVSVFEIDSFRSIISWAEQRARVTYGSDPVVTKALRVLSDHGRSMTFLASDGVMPSNEGRGYVLRRVLRRAVQQADRLGMYRDGSGGVLAQLAEQVVDGFGTAYPELVQQRQIVAELLTSEEERFLRTMSSGSERLSVVIDAALEGGAATLAGDDAFQLHDTYGFPVELTEELARERGLAVDRSRFDELMREQRERARAAGAGSMPVEQAAAFVRLAGATTFVGYDETDIETRVAAIEPVGDDHQVLIKLERSPFYAEGGGQVSDSGVITGSAGQATVEHVLRYDGDQVVLARLDGIMHVGDDVRAQVDRDARAATEANHTATHLLHWALRSQLGDHVHQKGSLVEPGRLRFDFSHTSGVTSDELDAIERAVNAHIAAGEDVAWQEMPIDAARDSGAMMLFGEKYGDIVRMVTVGEGFSRELCGGTHVRNTAQIRQFLVTSEASVGSHTRRIEALTGEGAMQWLRSRASVAQQAAAHAHVDVHRLVEHVEQLTATTRRLERELSAARSAGMVDEALQAVQLIGNINAVVFRADGLDNDELLELADRLRSKLAPAAVLLGAAAADGKVQFVASMSDEAVAAGMKAGDIIRQVAPIVGGGGGGRPTMAQAGGRDASRLDEALAAGRDALQQAAAAGSTA